MPKRPRPIPDPVRFDSLPEGAEFCTSAYHYAINRCCTFKVNGAEGMEHIGQYRLRVPCQPHQLVYPVRRLDADGEVSAA
jgi:hypothetical protein